MLRADNDSTVSWAKSCGRRVLPKLSTFLRVKYQPKHRTMKVENTTPVRPRLVRPELFVPKQYGATSRTNGMTKKICMSLCVCERTVPFVPNFSDKTAFILTERWHIGGYKASLFFPLGPENAGSYAASLLFFLPLTVLQMYHGPRTWSTQMCPTRNSFSSMLFPGLVPCSNCVEECEGVEMLSSTRILKKSETRLGTLDLSCQHHACNPIS